MNLDDFWNDLQNDWDDYWENSNTTGSSSFMYSTRTDDDGKVWASYESSSYSIDDYIPKERINIESIYNKIVLEEKNSVKLEKYERAAMYRDKARRVKEHAEVLIKLYDIKKRAVEQGDFVFAQSIKDKIQMILNGEEY